jgi:hypothetical protein
MKGPSGSSQAISAAWALLALPVTGDAELAQFDDAVRRQRIVSGEKGSVNGIPF